MKKYFFTMAVIAIFTIGFAASDDSDEVRYKNGREYHKKIPKCHNCGEENPYHYYWEDSKGNKLWDGNGGDSSNWKFGYYFCNTCLAHPDRIKSFY